MARRKTRLVLCLENAEYPASLEVRKIHEMLPAKGEEDLGMICVIDESGEDYLYPEEIFAILPENAFDALRLTAKTRRRVLESLSSP